MAIAMKWAIACVTCACAFVAPVAARAERVTLPVSSSPLPGSGFQGGDGDQDDYADWGTAQSYGYMVYDQSDPDDADGDTVFAAGSRELEPGRWDLLTREDAGTQPAADLGHAWCAIEERGPEVFLNAAFLRAGDGDAHIVLDLSRMGGGWYNGHNGIPCRSTGDLVVSLDRDGSQTSAAVQVWETTSYSPYSGCAATGVLRDVPDVQAGIDVQGAFNAASIPNHLPGAPATIDPGRFGELSINLSSIQRRVPYPDGGCFSYQSLWPHTRASTSDDAALDDIVDQTWLQPRNCSAWGTKFDDINGNGVQDAGEPGVPGVRVWADYNQNGEFEDYEPWSVTDDQGHYRIEGIRQFYQLREEMLSGQGRDGWVCSFPAY
ncbi:SdrD B-like domain-containing protein [Conexibacter woesei]|uniref:SdrD B-like domain-containing protein n=1 Tax=Conexibacter woesei TaxID=191495 RepID=UPI00047BF0FA|nr:hypothetical protein [Conexibacter woesei]